MVWVVIWKCYFLTSFTEDPAEANTNAVRPAVITPTQVSNPDNETPADPSSPVPSADINEEVSRPLQESSGSTSRCQTESEPQNQCPLNHSATSDVFSIVSPSNQTTERHEASLSSQNIVASTQNRYSATQDANRHDTDSITSNDERDPLISTDTNSVRETDESTEPQQTVALLRRSMSSESNSTDDSNS